MSLSTYENFNIGAQLILLKIGEMNSKTEDLFHL